MKKDKHKTTDLSMNEYDALRSAELEDVRIDQHEYQQVIESLMYAAIHTRLDIVFALNQLSQYLSNFAKHHEHVLKKLIWYVRFIIDLVHHVWSQWKHEVSKILWLRLRLRQTRLQVDSRLHLHAW